MRTAAVRKPKSLGSMASICRPSSAGCAVIDKTAKPPRWRAAITLPHSTSTRWVQLARLVDTTPDATLDQLRQALRKECSLVAIHNALKRLDYRYKKRCGPKNKNAPT